MTTFKDLCSDAFWQKARTDERYRPLCDAVRSEYEKYTKDPIPSITFADYMLFSRRGDRLVYQGLFFGIQHRVYACALMAILYPDENKYLADLEDAIFAYCNLYTWTLPAHMPTVTENKIDQLDLDATTSAAALAIICKILGNRLSPLIVSRIDYETKRRVIEPFRREKWFWEDLDNNWNSVCTAGVAVTVMLSYPELLPELLPRFERSEQLYIDTCYQDDGVCPEGPGYWSYGFGYYFVYADMLREFTGIDHFKQPRVKAIATYYQKIFLEEKVAVTYGDTGMTSTTAAGMLYALKAEYPDDVTLPDPSVMFFDVHYFPYMLNAFRFREAIGEDDGFDRNVTYYLPDAGQYVRRTPYYGFGARGGSNGECHNHNDVGSFILSVHNRQILCDVGTSVYVKEYFTDVRYTKFFEASSRSHNVPIIDGKNEGNFKDTRSVTSFDGETFAIEFANAYGIADMSSLRREISTGEDFICLRDTYRASRDLPFTERFITCDEPKIEKGAVGLQGATIRFDPSYRVGVTVEKRALTRDVNGEIDQFFPVYCVDVELPLGKRTFECRIEVDHE